MALATSTIAMIGLAVSAVGTVGSLYMGAQANQAQRAAARNQRQAAGVQKAQQQAQAAQERRQQIREERIKRATILQQASNTGSSESSGETGAISGMGTQLATNIGINQAAINAGNLITGFNQQAADNMTRANTYQGYGNMFGQIGSMGGSMFGQAGGWNTLFGK